MVNEKDLPPAHCCPLVLCALKGLVQWFAFVSLLCREDQVNFRGFMRTLAHFRPIEDNEKNKDPTASEPLNSRTNKLLCESGGCHHRVCPAQSPAALSDMAWGSLGWIIGELIIRD